MEKLEELKKELNNVKTGENILLLRRQMITAEIKEMIKMSEYEEVKFCKDCEAEELHLFSGSGNKMVCAGCVAREERAILIQGDKPNFQIEDEWNLENEIEEEIEVD